MVIRLYKDNQAEKTTPIKSGKIRLYADKPKDAAPVQPIIKRQPIEQEETPEKQFLKMPWYKQLFTKRVAKELPGAIKDIGVSVLRSFPQAPVRTGLEIDKAIGLTDQNEYKPTSKAGKILLGDEPVKDFEGYGRDTTQFIEALGLKNVSRNKTVNKVIGAGMTALDILPFGLGKKKVAETAAKNLIESVPKEEIGFISKTLKNTSEKTRTKPDIQNIVSREAKDDGLSALRDEAANISQTPMYHGSKYTFDNFDTAQMGKVTNAESAKNAFFFTDKPEIAKGYANIGDMPSVDAQQTIVDNLEKIAQKSGKNSDWDKHTLAVQKLEELAYGDTNKNFEGNVKQFYLDMKNPYVQDMKGVAYNEKELANIVKNAKAKGYDGIVLKNAADAVHTPIGGGVRPPEEISTVTAVFKPEQIKSQPLKTGDGATKIKPKVELPGIEKAAVKPKGDDLLQELNKPREKIPYDLMNSESGAQIFDEMANAQAGFRTRGAEIQGAGDTHETISAKSTFPDWVPSNLRSRKLFDQIQSHLLSDTSPIKGKQLQLYKMVKAELEKRTSYSGAVAIKEPLESPITSGQLKTAKLATGVEEKAIENKLVKTLGDLPEYQQVNMKEQAKFAKELLDIDEETAIRIARGQEAPPAHLLPESIFTAVEEKAIREGNIDLLKQLASSNRATEASAMGQRIRALAERNPDSPVKAIKDIADERAKVFEVKTGKKASKVVEETTKEIKKAIPKVTKETWESFVESIRCK